MPFISKFLKTLPIIGGLFVGDSLTPLSRPVTIQPVPAEDIRTLHQQTGLDISPISKIKVQSIEGRIITVSGIITREDLRANPKITWLFGDNVEDHNQDFELRRGQGGQAKEMAGEPNAVGIPTLWKAPNGVDQSVYFSEEDSDRAKAVIDQAFGEIRPDQKIVIPVNDQGQISLGTDRAELLQRAPSLLEYIRTKVQELAASSLSN